MELVELQTEDHLQSLTETLRAFSKSNTLTRIGLVSEDDDRIGVHCILAVHQELIAGLFTKFNEYFVKETKEQYYFIFENIRSTTLVKAVDLMYMGCVEMVNDDLNEFYKVLDILKLNESQYSTICDPDLNTRFTLQNHGACLTNLWSSRTQLECDVIFVTSDFLQLNAHSLIISGNSKYMLNLFLKHKARRKAFTFILQNVKREHLESVVEFCYKGRVCFGKHDLKEVFEVAHLLGVEALCEKILSLDPSVKVQNVTSCRVDISSRIKTAHSPKLDDQSKLCSQIFSEIMDCEQLCDITLIAGSNIHKLHLAVLIKFCPFFLDVITKCDIVKDSFVLVKDLGSNHTQSLVDYIYKGETEFLGSTKDFCTIMKEWIKFEILPICESKECQILSSSKTRTEMERREGSTIFLESMKIGRAPGYKSQTNRDKLSRNGVDLESAAEDDAESAFPDEDNREDNSHSQPPAKTPRHKKCQTCDLEFSTYKLLREHTVIHPEARVMRCKYCGKKFDRVSQMNLHLRIHTGARPYQCPDCGVSFAAKSALVQHKLTHSADQRNLFVCDICSKTFSRKQYMKEHIRSHTGTKPYKCAICHKTFVGRTGLNHHTKTHDRNTEAVCEVCGKSFTRHALWTHMKSHDKTHKCTTCHKYYATNSALNIHEASAHLGHRNHQCEVCGKGFVQKTHLDRHSKVHKPLVKNTAPGSFSCEKCTKGFKSEAKLQSHFKREHSEPGDKPFSCEVCHKKFAGRSTAIYHQRGHTGELPYSCQTCGKSFARPDTYQKHLRLHARVPGSTKSRARVSTQTFECNVCSKKYSSKSALHKHATKAHGTLPYPGTVKLKQSGDDLTCNICNKTVKTSRQLTVHSRSHENKSVKLACEICNKSFRSEAILKKHLDVHMVASSSPTPELPPMYTFQQCEPSYNNSYVNSFISNPEAHIEIHDQYHNIDDHENNTFIDEKSSDCIRRPYSINIDGNLCCNDEDKLIRLQDGSDITVEPAMLAQDSSIELHQLHQIHPISPIDTDGNGDIETTPLSGLLADTIGDMIGVTNVGRFVISNN